MMGEGGVISSFDAFHPHHRARRLGRVVSTRFGFLLPRTLVEPNISGDQVELQPVPLSSV